MKVEEDVKQILSTFDIIKSRLNELLINGMENFHGQKVEEIKLLSEKLAKMNLGLISELLESFLKSLDSRNKNEIAKKALNLIACTRLIESIMNLELVKKGLIEWMD